MRDLTKVMEVMNLKTISEVVENAIYSVFVSEYGRHIKDLGDAFIINIPIDRKLDYNSSRYDLLGCFEINGQLIHGTAYCFSIYFDLGVYDADGELVTDKFNDLQIERNLVPLFNQILGN